MSSIKIGYYRYVAQGIVTTSLSLTLMSCLSSVSAPSDGAATGTVAKASLSSAQRNSPATPTPSSSPVNQAPSSPVSVSCPTDPAASSALNACTITAASPADSDGNAVTYADAGSTCAAVVVDASSGSATFTAPAKGSTCVVQVKANDGSLDSASTSSATITGANRAPNSPASVSCTIRPVGLSTGNTCSVAANSTLDPDGDSVTYLDDSSTCAATTVDASTGAVTYTAPSKGSSCVVRVKANDGALSSTGTSSSTITALGEATIRALPAPSANNSVPSTNNCAGTPALTITEAGFTYSTECKAIDVSCAGVQYDATAVLLIYTPTSEAVKGTVILGTGGGGTSLYEQGFVPPEHARDNLVVGLLQDGFRVVQRAWYSGGANRLNWTHPVTGFNSNGWVVGPGGMKNLACRYATLARKVYDTYHKPTNSDKPFCISGNSGGSTEVSYAMATYGAGEYVDMALPTGGPPMARLDYACMGPQRTLTGGTVVGSSSYLTKLQEQAYLSLLPSSFVRGTAGSLQVLDLYPGVPFVPTTPSTYQDTRYYLANHSMGWAVYDGAYQDGVNACYLQTHTPTVNPAMEATWYQDSILSSDAVLSYPNTDMRFLIGANEVGLEVPFSNLYYQSITSDRKAKAVVAGANHEIGNTAAGATAVKEAIIQNCKKYH